MELTKNALCHSQLSISYKKKKHWKVTLTGNETKRNTRKKLSTIYHLIMSIFSSFHFVCSMKILALIRG